MYSVNKTHLFKTELDRSGFVLYYCYLFSIRSTLWYNQIIFRSIPPCLVCLSMYLEKTYHISTTLFMFYEDF